MQQISIEEEKLFDGFVFPFTYTPREVTEPSEIYDYIKANQSNIMENLLKHGAILFRGFNIKDAKEFNDFALTFGWEDLPYIGN
jgi:hypothetical protein